MTDRPRTRGGYPSTTTPVTEFRPPTVGTTTAAADECDVCSLPDLDDELPDWPDDAIGAAPCRPVEGAT